jgi:hypothetical protein
MIGRPEWFTNKRYTGTGIRPNTWQGWVYVLVAIAMVAFVRWQPYWDWSQQVRNTVTIVIAVVVVLDVIHIMYILNKNKGNE